MILRTFVATLAFCVSSAAAAHSFWLEPTQHDLQVVEEEQALWRAEPLEGASPAVVRRFAKYETQMLKHGSRYLLSAVRGVPAPNDARADCCTIFSSLTVRPS